MGYYIDQLAEQDRQKRLADLLAMQQDSSDPGVQFDTPQQPMPPQGSLSDLMNSGASRDQINAMLSQSTMTSTGFDPAGTTGRGEPYMPPQELPVNMIRNNTTGRVFSPTDLQGNPSQSQPAGLAADWSRPVDVMGAKGHWASDNSGRIILRDGRIVDPGRDTGRERAIEKENLALQKQRLELAQLQGKPSSELEKARAKMLADIEGEQMKAKIPGTAEYERLEKRNIGGKKEQSAWAGSVKQADQMDDYINRILGEGQYKEKGGKLGFFATGLPGQVLQNMGGTDARDLRGDLNRIKAIIGFEELNKMRRESPTGGALGQVTERELEFLQSVEGSLDQAQSPEQLEKMLWDVKSSAARLKNDLIKNPPNGMSGGGQVPQKSGAERQTTQLQEGQLGSANGRPAMVKDGKWVYLK